MTTAASTIRFSAGLPKPTDPRKRIQALDVIRGATVLGLILANMPYYRSSGFAPLHGWPHSLDGAINMLLMIFAQGKVYAVFSFLFGLGAVMQSATIGNNTQFSIVYLRRMIVLLCIGFVHAVLIWPEDILMTYAVLGLLLIPLWNLRQKALLAVAAFLLVSPVLINSARMLSRSPRPASSAAQAGKQQTQPAADPEQVYATGTYGEITAQRVHDFRARIPGLLSAMPHMFAMMLLGVYVGRRGIIDSLESHVAQVRRVFWWGLVLGLAGNIGSVGLRMVLPRGGPSFWFFVSMFLFYMGAPALAFAYSSGIVLLVRRPGVEKRLRILAPAGRATLTNYLMQSVICTLLFYGYGFGLYGKLGVAAGFGLSLAIFAAQLIFSRLWLKYFSFGPIEWLWRLGTYGRPYHQERSMIASRI